MMIYITLISIVFLGLNLILRKLYTSIYNLRKLNFSLTGDIKKIKENNLLLNNILHVLSLTNFYVFFNRRYEGVIILDGDSAVNNLIKVYMKNNEEIIDREMLELPVAADDCFFKELDTTKKYSVLITDLSGSQYDKAMRWKEKDFEFLKVDTIDNLIRFYRKDLKK